MTLRSPTVRVSVAALTHLASRNKCSLQVPDLAIVGDALVQSLTAAGGDVIDAPRTWFVRRWDCWFLTREGYEANRRRIRAAFESSYTTPFYRGNTWTDFEAAAEAEIEQREQAAQAAAKRKQRRKAGGTS